MLIFYENLIIFIILKFYAFLYLFKIIIFGEFKLSLTKIRIFQNL